MGNCTTSIHVFDATECPITWGRRYSSSETIELEDKYIKQVLERIDQLEDGKFLELRLTSCEVECAPVDVAKALARRLKEVKGTKTTLGDTQTYQVTFAHQECNGLLAELDSYVFHIQPTPL